VLARFDVGLGGQNGKHDHRGNHTPILLGRGRGLEAAHIMLAPS
jgi:hypothetical protein